MAKYSNTCSFLFTDIGSGFSSLSLTKNSIKNLIENKELSINKNKLISFSIMFFHFV